MRNMKEAEKYSCVSGIYGTLVSMKDEGDISEVGLESKIPVQTSL